MVPRPSSCTVLPMPLSIATWNINSVRLRAGLVQKFLTEQAPDIICLQETKCPNDQFPHAAFRSLGYIHNLTHGQKGYHGVAILSRIPLEPAGSLILGGHEHARHIAARVLKGAFAGLVVHNFYVPAGGDEPDPAINPKFAHKLAYLDDLTRWGEGLQASGEIMVGDLNIAPLPTDVWSHQQMLRIVSHTPVETEGLIRVQNAGRWIDAVRAHIPPENRLFSWWSYRAADWLASDRGRRLDHIWVSPDLASSVQRVDVLKDARGWERPSDHVPLVLHLES